MAERLRETAELDPAPIAGALEDWLQLEIESSMGGKNAYLDDWKQFQKDSKLPFDDDNNQNAGKARSHYDRLFRWSLDTEQYPDFFQDDYWLARQMFCAQMFISGAYRKQCFIEANVSKDYLKRRKSQGPAGIDILSSISRRLDEYSSGNPFPDHQYKNTPEAQLINRTLRINNMSLEVSKAVHSECMGNTPTNNNHAVKLLGAVQGLWTELIVDYIVYAAQQKGGKIEDVAMLEPKSISENPKMYYPFKEIGR
jgi:hypothetical protein